MPYKTLEIIATADHRDAIENIAEKSQFMSFLVWGGLLIVLIAIILVRSMNG